MALNPQELSGEIIAELQKVGFFPAAEGAAGSPFWLAVATAITNHIQKNATVAVTGGSSAGEYKVS